MKASLLLAVLVALFFSAGPRVSRWAQEASGRPTGGSSHLPVVPQATDAARKFNVTVSRVIPGGVVAGGAYYNVPPSETIQPQRLDPRDSNRTPVSQMIIQGLDVETAFAGQKWQGWMVPAGEKNLKVAEGEWRSVPAWRVVPEPPASRPKAGLWMKYHGRTSLD